MLDDVAGTDAESSDAPDGKLQRRHDQVDVIQLEKIKISIILSNLENFSLKSLAAKTCVNIKGSRHLPIY